MNWTKNNTIVAAKRSTSPSVNRYYNNNISNGNQNVFSKYNNANYTLSNNYNSNNMAQQQKQHQVQQQFQQQQQQYQQQQPAQRAQLSPRQSKNIDYPNKPVDQQQQQQQQMRYSTSGTSFIASNSTRTNQHYQHQQQQQQQQQHINSNSMVYGYRNGPPPNSNSSNNNNNAVASRQWQQPDNGAAPVYNANNQQQQYPTSTIDQILPRLYISDDIAARNKRLLDEKKITHILNLTTNIPNKFEPDITYMKLNIFDFENQNIDQYFDSAFQFIENAFKEPKNSVLVHCNAGISRSSSFIIAYLMLKQIHPKYKDALEYVRKRRPIINPNKGFERQLINLESRVKRKGICVIM